MSAPWVFDQQHYEHLNRARAGVVSRVLADLRVPLGLKTAVDLGCGLGYFSGLLKSLGLDVTAVDGRQHNLEEAQRRQPGIRFKCFDAEDRAISSLGKFDLVLCFGLLYHLENPLLAIRHIHAMAAKLVLVESVIFPGDEPIMALVDEGPHEDQGLNHFAFYPTEACLVKMLYRSGFANVYGIRIQPDHREYHVATNTRRTRTMLAASFDQVPSRLVKRLTEPRTSIAPWDPTSGAPKPHPLQRLRQFAKQIGA